MKRIHACITRALGAYTNDTAIDSELTRMELALFLEREFGVMLDETKFTTVREVIAHVYLKRSHR